MRMNLYGIVFRASREIGQAVILSDLTGKDGSANCRSAAALLRLTNEKVYVNEAAQLDRIASNWRGLLRELAPTWNRIQYAFGENSGQYHSASSGFLMGMAIAGCANVGRESDFSRVNSDILSFLEGAKLHTKAIKDQGFKENMIVPEMDFNSLIGGIQSIGRTTADRSQEYHRTVQLVRALSDRVLEAIVK